MRRWRNVDGELRDLVARLDRDGHIKDAVLVEETRLRLHYWYTRLQAINDSAKQALER